MNINSLNNHVATREVTTRKKRNVFQFKQFSIDAKEAGMPVSTDGVLLGAWIQEPLLQSAHLSLKHNKTPSLLDLGCGTGLLALMCAQRFPKLQITAIDIEHNAVIATQHNVDHSPWADRITVVEDDVLTTILPSNYDSIICNPPYFNQGQTAQNHQRAMARHTLTLSHHALLQRCLQLLKPNGTAHFIFPLTEGEAFIKHAGMQNWSVVRCCYVRSFAHHSPQRLLLTLQKKCTINTTILTKMITPEINDLTIYQTELQGKPLYSTEFTELTKDFYLKM